WSCRISLPRHRLFSARKCSTRHAWLPGGLPPVRPESVCYFLRTCGFAVEFDNERRVYFPDHLRGAAVLQHADIPGIPIGVLRIAPVDVGAEAGYRLFQRRRRALG